MHIYALISLVAILVSAAFAAVSIAWHSERRRTGGMTAIFVCTGVWALLDLLCFLQPDPELARFWSQWIDLPTLLLGPSLILLLGQILPQVAGRMRALLPWSLGAAVALGLTSAFLPSSGVEVVASGSGGWVPRADTLSLLVIPLGMILPAVAVVQATRAERDRGFAKLESNRIRAIGLAFSVSLVVVCTTEILLPLLQIPSPRLGALTVASLSGFLWLCILHFADNLSVTPEGMARSMLAELHDGVALIQLDGTILSSNIRLTAMTGLASTDLMGRSLATLVDASIESLRAGLEESEAQLHTLSGHPVPVSLSSSIVRGRAGDPVGVVVILRDLREVDGLRRRLVNSGRLAAFGELAAGIAHEVNNPIAFIRSDLNLLARRLAEIRARLHRSSESAAERGILARAAARIDTALEGIEHVAEVVGDVREFAHVGGTGQGGSDPRALVEGAMRLAALQRGDEVELRHSSCEFGERIESGQELKQVLLALLRVLVEGVEKGGAVETDLEIQAGRLRITFVAAPLVEQVGQQMLDRFEALGREEPLDPHVGFELSIATELIEQLGGAFAVAARGADGIEIALDLPLETESPR
jgi:PAS domain S-box-containing protein